MRCPACEYDNTPDSKFCLAPSHAPQAEHPVPEAIGLLTERLPRALGLFREMGGRLRLGQAETTLRA